MINLKNKTILLNIAIITLIITFCWPSILYLANVYNNVPEYSHGFLIPFLVGYIVWDRVKQGQTISMATPFGWPFLLGGGLVVILAQWYIVAIYALGLKAATLASIGLLFLLVGLCLLLLGWAWLKEFKVPLCLILLSIPLPQAVTNQFTLPAKRVVAQAAEYLLRILDIAVYRDGNILHLFNTSLGVADACSGIRSLWAFWVVGFAIIYFLRPSNWAKVTIIVMAPILAILENILRVTTTGLLALYVDLAWIDGWRHDLTGWLYFLIFSAFILWFAKATENVSKASSDKVTNSSSSIFTSNVMGPYLVVSLLLLIILQSIITNHYNVVYPEDGNRKSLQEFPSKIAGFYEEGQGDLLNSQLEMLKPDDYVVRSYYDQDQNPIKFWALYWAASNDRENMFTGVPGPHAPDLCFPGGGWAPVSKETYEQDLKEITSDNIALRHFRKDSQDIVVLYWSRGNKNVFWNYTGWNFNELLSLLAKTWRTPIRDFPVQYTVTIQVPVTDSFDMSKQRAISFAKEIAQILPEYGITDD